MNNAALRRTTSLLSKVNILRNRCFLIKQLIKVVRKFLQVLLMRFALLVPSKTWLIPSEVKFDDIDNIVSTTTGTIGAHIAGIHC